MHLRTLTLDQKTLDEMVERAKAVLFSRDGYPLETIEFDALPLAKAFLQVAGYPVE